MTHSEDAFHAFIQAYRKKYPGIRIPWARPELFQWIERRGIPYTEYAIERNRVQDSIADAFSEV